MTRAVKSPTARLRHRVTKLEQDLQFHRAMIRDLQMSLLALGTQVERINAKVNPQPKKAETAKK